jgi:hypothetical protein
MSSVTSKFRPGDTVRYIANDDADFDGKIAVVLDQREVGIPWSMIDTGNVLLRFPEAPNTFSAVIDTPEEKPWHKNDFWQLPESKLELLGSEAYCPVCEKELPSGRDYLCRKCRYGI